MFEQFNKVGNTLISGILEDTLDFVELVYWLFNKQALHLSWNVTFLEMLGLICTLKCYV